MSLIECFVWTRRTDVIRENGIILSAKGNDMYRLQATHLYKLSFCSSLDNSLSIVSEPTNQILECNSLMLLRNRIGFNR